MLDTAHRESTFLAVWRVFVSEKNPTFVVWNTSGPVALGVPDYLFVNDAGLGFGVTSTEVFDGGESVVLKFPWPLRNIPGQHDLVISSFVGGLGASDNADVQVEEGGDGTNFAIVAIRLTNLSGSSEGFRLDAVEGWHSNLAADDAFEVRFDRSRRWRANPRTPHGARGRYRRMRLWSRSFSC